VAQACNPSYSGGKRSGGLWFKVSLRQIVHEILSLKYPTQKKKRAERVTQMVEYLPSKCEALNLNPRMAGKIKKRC
jgi:hypothetical protein